MGIEFINEVNADNWRDVVTAYNVRKTNVNLTKNATNKRMLLEQLEERPDYFLMKENFQLILEMAADVKKMWDKDDTLEVYFFGGENDITKQVMHYASMWSEHCSIRFKVTDKQEKGKIRIDFKEPSSFSVLGTNALLVPKNQPTMNFGWLSEDLPDREFKRVVLHEFGHALGLIHEHQSPRVNIDWNKPYVYWYFQEYHGWTSDQVDRNIFEEFETERIRATELDKFSIMGYYLPPECTYSRIDFPLNYDLSQMDKDFIGQIYP